MIDVHDRNVRRVAAAAALVFAVLAAAYYIFWMPNRSTGPAGIVVTIPRGSSFRAAAESLEAAGAIRSRRAFSLAGRVLGYTKSIKVGRYLFAGGLSNIDMLRDMKEGKSRLIIAVTIPEGWRMEWIARKFARELGVDSAKIVSMCRDSAFVARHRINAPTLEGYLLPETYKFYWQTDEQEIVDRMLEGFTNFYADSLRNRADRLNLSLNEVLTLASIVEGESGIDEERPIIAGVYWNRLRKHMKLEADPTIQYVIEGGPRRLLFDDLRLDSPYNTYLYAGLPPGPINNPGKKSILATLYPEKNDYLYFVATGVGGHRFSKNFSEHQKAVKNFHRVRRELKRQATGG